MRRGVGMIHSVSVRVDQMDENEWYRAMRKIFKAMVALEQHKYLEPKLSYKMHKLLKVLRYEVKRAKMTLRHLGHNEHQYTKYQWLDLSGVCAHSSAS